MVQQLGYWCQLNPNPFCNDYYSLAINVNAVATLIVVKTIIIIIQDTITLTH